MRCGVIGCVERRARRGEGQRGLALALAANPADVEERLARAPRQLGDAQRPRQRVASDCATSCTSEGSRRRRARAVLGGRGDLGRLRLEVEQLRQELGARHAVDRAVVDLASPWRSLPPSSPRRCTSPTAAWCGRAAGCTRRPRTAASSSMPPGAGQRAPGACGSRCRSRVVDPVGVAQPERDLDQPSAEDRGQLQARPHQVAQLVEGVAARARWRGRTSPPWRRACAGWASPDTGTPRPAR